MRHERTLQEGAATVRAALAIALICGAIGVTLAGYRYLVLPAVPAEVRLSVQPLDLSRPPATEELMAAGQLGGPLYPTRYVAGGRRSDAVRLSFGQAIDAWNRHEYPKAVEMFEQHAARYPDSPWVSEAILHIGCDAYYRGRYREAEERFQWILRENGQASHPGARMLVQKARQRLAILRVTEKKFREAQELFRQVKEESSDWRDRTYAIHWLQKLGGYKADQTALLNCGYQAMAHVLRREGRETEARQLAERVNRDPGGQSLQELRELAAGLGFGLTGLRLSDTWELARLPLPAVLYVERKREGEIGHYWVLERVEGERVELVDPQTGRWFTQQLEELAGEWDGRVLVFEEAGELPGVRLADWEMVELRGGCCGVMAGESGLGNDGRNQAGQSGQGPDGDVQGDSSPVEGCGAPVWDVNIINMNFYMTDTPLWYANPIGPSLGVTLSYNSQSATNQHEPFGNKWQFNYGSFLVEDTSGQVTLFTPDGRRDVYAPQGGGDYLQPYRVYNTLTKTGAYRFELRSPGDWVSVYDIPAGTASQQPFLVEQRDPYGQKLTFGYDTQVQLTTITDALGRVTTLTYNAAGLVTQVSDPFGRSAGFEYDGQKNLTKITDMGGYWTRFTYDANVFLTGLEDTRGRWTFYTEPADGVVGTPDEYPQPGSPMWENYRITVTDPLGGKAEYFWYGGCDAEEGCGGFSWYVKPRDYIAWQSPQVNNYRSNVPKVRYIPTQMILGSTGTSTRPRGEIGKLRFPGGGFLQYTYDQATGDRTGVTDAHSHAGQSSYNSLGLATSITNARGQTTNFTYAANQLDLLQIQNGLGTVQLAYNGTHDPTSITDRTASTTLISYNGYGRPTSVTNALGVVTGMTYNAQHRLQQVTREGQTLAAYTYDAVGRVRTATDATGLTITYDYNNLDNVTRETYPDGKTVSLVYSDCCPYLVDSVTDRGGRTALFTYDALRRLTASTNPEGGVTRYAYDANGNLVGLTDANGTETTFEYDLDDQVIRRTYADGKTVQVAYDSMGLPLTVTNARGAVTTYNFDANHNLLRQAYSDGTPAVEYVYDEYDRPTRRNDGLGIFQYSYDADSQLLAVDGPWADDTVSYQYDGLGRRTQMQVQSGSTVAYGWDTLDRLVTVQGAGGTFSYGYGPVSPLVQSLTRPNGSVTGYQYDGLNRLTDIANKTSGAAVINEYGYGYNAQDLRDTETSTNGVPQQYTQSKLSTFQYNTLNQVVSQSNPARAFTYDADGNLSGGVTPAGYVFAAVYDAEDRLKTVEYTDGGGNLQKTEFLHGGDHFLRTVRKYTNGALQSETRFVTDGLLPVEERDGANATVRGYAWGLNYGGGIGGLLGLRQGGQDYAYLYDGRGNVVSVIDGAQSVVAGYGYSPFGIPWGQTGTLDQPYGFSTKLYDADLGMSYFGYRYYWPERGRWLSRDPLRESAGMNLYAYVGNSPIGMIDPEGKFWGYVGAGVAVVGYAVASAIDWAGTDITVPTSGDYDAMSWGPIVLKGKHWKKFREVKRRSILWHERYHRFKQGHIDRNKLLDREIDVRCAEIRMLKRVLGGSDELGFGRNLTGPEVSDVEERIKEISRDLYNNYRGLRKKYQNR